MMSGWKTYITGFSLILYGVFYQFIHLSDANGAFQSIASGFGLIGIRHAITTAVAK